MDDILKRIKEIENEISKIPYHKGTEHHIGKLKARIARLKDEERERVIKKGGGQGFAIKKSGEATVVLLGPPSVGKSTLLNKLTGAHSKVAAYDFTTLQVIPGMAQINGAKIQIMDLPGIIGQAAKGKGRGREILSMARVADLLIIMVDIFSMVRLNDIKKDLYEAGVRLDLPAADIKINKKLKGGLKIIAPQLTIGLETVKTIASEFRLINGEIIILGNPKLEEIIDAFIANRVFLPYLVVVNKIDKAKTRADLEAVFISAERGIGLDNLKEAIWQKLSLIRVYLKPEGREADWQNPLILKKGETVIAAAEKIHADFAQSVKEALVWGQSAKFPGQKVSLSHKLLDQDQLTLIF